MLLDIKCDISNPDFSNLKWFMSKITRPNSIIFPSFCLLCDGKRLIICLHMHNRFWIAWSRPINHQLCCAWHQGKQNLARQRYWGLFGRRDYIDCPISALLMHHMLICSCLRCYTNQISNSYLISPLPVICIVCCCCGGLL